MSRSESGSGSGGAGLPEYARNSHESEPAQIGWQTRPRPFSTPGGRHGEARTRERAVYQSIPLRQLKRLRLAEAGSCTRAGLSAVRSEDPIRDLGGCEQQLLDLVVDLEQRDVSPRHL